ncbi:hypothetical protein P030_02265 [Anaplasma phagocytophilum str. CRT35]|nr:hypothetical protein P030_02265 [Anaplasma phagocytophilum str. CRT35]
MLQQGLKMPKTVRRYCKQVCCLHAYVYSASSEFTSDTMKFQSFHVAYYKSVVLKGREIANSYSIAKVLSCALNLSKLSVWQNVFSR